MVINYIDNDLLYVYARGRISSDDFFMFVPNMHIEYRSSSIKQAARRAYILRKRSFVMLSAYSGNILACSSGLENIILRANRRVILMGSLALISVKSNQL